MKNQWIRTTGVIVLSVIMLSAINAQPHDGKGNGPHGHGHPGIEPGHGRTQPLSCLNLTEEQQEQMQALRLENYKIMKPLRNKMVELKARERTLLSEDETDMKAVYKVIDEQTDLKNRMHKLRVEHKVAAKKLLTDEQIMNMEQRGRHARRWKSGGHDGVRPYHRDGHTTGI